MPAEPDAPRFDQRFTVRGATEEDLTSLCELIQTVCEDAGFICEFEETMPCQ